jgi:hypothetical protein
MTDNSKITRAESEHIDHIRSMSPMMAALANQTDSYYRLAESDRLWSELDSAS